MTNFHYVATNAAGSTIQGNIEAADRSSVLSTLSRQNLKPISVKEGASKKGSFTALDFFGAHKIKSDDLVMFTRLHYPDCPGKSRQ
jgi:type II secretory pathway component PulF